MMKKTYLKPQDQPQEDVLEKYFEHEDPKATRRKIRKEDLDTLETWADSEGKR